jgi:putative transposase
MSINLWIEGTIVEFKDKTPCRRAMVREVRKKDVTFADISNGNAFNLQLTYLDDALTSNNIVFLSESRDISNLRFSELSEKEQQEVSRRYGYVKNLREKGILKITANCVEAIKLIADERGEKAPHWQTVRAWHKGFEKAGYKIKGLYPKHRSKGFRESRIDQAVIEIIRKAAPRYFRSSQPTMASIVQNVEDAIIAHNLEHCDKALKIPSYLTIKARVEKTSYQFKKKSRSGKDSYRAEEAGDGKGIKTFRILERVEIDHTQLDVHLLDDDSKTLLGRPTITVLIDHYSHMVLGFQLSFEDASYAAVCIACINGFMQKDDYLSLWKCDYPWPAHGVPSVIVTDNGNEFWGKSFTSVADEIGSLFDYCPIRKANYKGRVERFFGILNSMVLDDFPGVVRKQGKCGDDYDARQEAKATISEFKSYFITWLTGIYHNLPLEESGMTPNELWNLSAEDFPVPKEDETELKTILLATDTRTLTKDGIRIFGLNYKTSVLKDLYRRDGPRLVTVKYNPFDLGSIFILDEVNYVYLEVDCHEYIYASGLSLYEHNLIKAEVNKHGKEKLQNNNDLLTARAKLSKDRDELHSRNARSKTQVTTSKAARAEKIGVDPIVLVVDNTKVTAGSIESWEDDIDLEGWGADQ